MPLYHFNCSKCKRHPVRKIAPTPAQALIKVGTTCPKCGAKMVRTPKPPTSNVVETLDNGHMTRAVERPAEAERLYKERADNDPRNKPE